MTLDRTVGCVLKNGIVGNSVAKAVLVFSLYFMNDETLIFLKKKL
jgi:hypothetical protein